MPLADYLDEVISIQSSLTMPSELLVKRGGFLRFAETEGRAARRSASFWQSRWRWPWSCWRIAETDIIADERMISGNFRGHPLAQLTPN
jgi:hypothetical protein